MNTAHFFIHAIATRCWLRFCVNSLCVLLVCVCFNQVAWASKAKKNDKTVTISYPSDSLTLDPAEQLSGMTLQVANLLFDPLVRLDRYRTMQPRLAERWEQLNATTFRFYLRKGVAFHSGNPMTADDVVFSFNRLRHSRDFRGLYSPYKGVVKLDDYTVDVIAKKPTPYSVVLYNMSYLFVMDSVFYNGLDIDGRDKTEVARNGGTFASQNVSGTGAFVFKSRKPGYQSIYVKNPNYWGESGNVEKIVLEPVAEDAKRAVALLFGTVDLANPVSPTHFEYVKNSPKHKLLKVAGDRIILFQMNQKAVPAFKDKRVRKAVIYAVDNAGIVQTVMRGFGTAAAQLSPKGFSGFVPDLQPRYDLEKAKKLMKEAGYEDGFVVQMIAPNNRYMNDKLVAQTVAAMLSKINIRVNLVTMPKSEYWPEFDKCEMGMQMIGWSSDTGDSANYSEFLTETKVPATGYGYHNCGYFSNTKIDGLLKKARSTLDSRKREEYLREVSRIEHDEALFLPLHWEDLAWGYTDKFENFPNIVNPKNFPYFGDLRLRQ